MCILLVEDEQPIRALVVDALELAGFDVFEAGTGDRAVDLIEAPPKEFTLLITDIDLPGDRNGLAVGGLMRRRHPTLPIIYITGRPGAVGPLGPKEALLPKPFRLQSLLRMVQDLLNCRHKPESLGWFV